MLRPPETPPSSSPKSGYRPHTRHEREEWERLDETVREWWAGDVVTVDDPRRAAVQSIALPRPYVAGAAPGSPDWYTTMFNWDTHLTNLALFAHDRADLVRDNVDNYLTLVEQFGYMPNGNEVPLSTRSQTPIFPDSVLRLVEHDDNDELLARAYPLLVREYREYWLADHHATPVGLATNRDLGDPTLDPRLAAEAETGLDWTTQFDGDVTQTTPVMTNCALVMYARTLAGMASRLELLAEAAAWTADANSRAALVRELCWSEERGQFLDYNFITQRHVSVLGATSYWALWSGVATAEQAARMAEGLSELLLEHGLVATDPSRPDPSLFALDYSDLQWAYPSGWPPLHLIACWGLDRYGFADAAHAVAAKFLETILRNYREHGALFEKYNVLDGGIVLPNQRYGTIPLHGWTSACVVLLGRRVHEGKTIDATLASVGA